MADPGRRIHLVQTSGDIHRAGMELAPEGVLAGALEGVEASDAEEVPVAALVVEVELDLGLPAHLAQP